MSEFDKTVSDLIDSIDSGLTYLWDTREDLLEQLKPILNDIQVYLSPLRKVT